MDLFDWFCCLFCQIANSIVHSKSKQIIGWRFIYLLFLWVSLFACVVNDVWVFCVDLVEFKAYEDLLFYFLTSLLLVEQMIMAHSEPMATERELIQVNAASRKPRILLAASGSVAAIKFGNLCHCFSEWAEVKAVATKASLHFIDRASLPKDVIIYTDEDEWSSWNKIGDSVLHIELRRWADIMVIAPLSANTLGKVICFTEPWKCLLPLDMHFIEVTFFVTLCLTSFSIRKIVFDPANPCARQQRFEGKSWFLIFSLPKWMCKIMLSKILALFCIATHVVHVGIFSHILVFCC